MNPLKTVVTTAAAALLFLTACKGSEGNSGDGLKAAPVVARVGEGNITAAEFQAKMEEQPAFIRSRYSSLESKREFLENLIRFEVLVQEARRQGMDQDPEVRATLEKVMVQKLVQKHAATVAATPPTKEELNKYYQDHISEFVRPERVRLNQVFLASASNDPKRSVVKAEADKLLAEVRRQEAGPNKTAFVELVRSRSDDASSKAMDGDLGFKTREELAALWGPEVADAAFRLKVLGELGQVATERGLHLLKLTNRQPGLEQTFDMVRERIESRLLMEKRSRAMDDLVTSLKTKAKIEIDDKVLGNLSVATEGVGTARSDNP